MDIFPLEINARHLAVGILAIAVYLLLQIMLGRYLAHCRHKQSMAYVDFAEQVQLAMQEAQRTGEPHTVIFGDNKVTVYSDRKITGNPALKRFLEENPVPDDKD